MDFSNCLPPSDAHELDTLLLSILDEIEECTGQELKINSAYRSQDYEVIHHRTGSSAHCLGKAVDIACYSNGLRHSIIKTALQNGVNRIGVYKTFIHLDVATAKDGKSTNVIWYG